MKLHQKPFFVALYCFSQHCGIRRNYCGTIHIYSNMNMSVNKKNKLIVFAAVLFSVTMVCFPQVTETGSKSAIIIWANSIVPVLLPFFIFSDFIKRTGNLEKLPPRVYPFLVAFLSGYPMGAKVTADLAAERNLSAETGRHILSYSLVTGPAFIMGTVGGFLGNAEAAVVVAFAHYVGALLNGMLWKQGDCRINELSKHAVYKESMLDGFTGSIMAGFKAMAIILAYLMFFMIGMNLLDEAGLFILIGNETVISMMKGMLEMTAGSSMVGACNISLSLKTVLISFLVSFGGLSVIGQSVSMAGGSGIGIADIIKIKITHGLLAGILAVIFSLCML